MEAAIFKNASTTYYWSSRFFPAHVRDDVFRLYSFVRVADDFVDRQPQDEAGFRQFVTDYRLSITKPAVPVAANDTKARRAVKNMVHISQKYNFDPGWTEAFLSAMESDLGGTHCKKLKESIDYMYGSAEVIGLFMSKIMALPEEAYPAAQMQGRAMQWVNFIRDIDEDNFLGRQYFPDEHLYEFGLKNLTEAHALAHPEQFKKLIRNEIDLYKKWQSEAEAGYKYIPKRLLVPLKTANQMYGWTAGRIYDNPFVVFEKKVKPSKPRVLATATRIFFKKTAKNH